MTKALILLDLSNIGFAAEAGTKLSAGAVNTTGVYGVLRTIRALKEQIPGEVIVLHDGRSWRFEVYPEYKAGRDVRPEMVELRAAWKGSKPLVVRALRALGVTQIFAGNMEADDLAARVRRVRGAQGYSVCLVSSDHDWLQLINANTWVHDTRKRRNITRMNFEEHTGFKSPLMIAESKALMGDSSDNIKGVGKIGEKTATALLNTWGSVDGFLNAMLGDPLYREGADKRMLSLLDAGKLARFRSNMELIWLDHPKSPPATETRALKGPLDRETFRGLAEEWAFASIHKNLDEWLQPFVRKD